VIALGFVFFNVTKRKTLFNLSITVMTVSFWFVKERKIRIVIAILQREFSEMLLSLLVSMKGKRFGIVQ
jgi:hypothetical protein